MNIILTGATGMVGSEVLKQALVDPQVSQITAIVRKPLTIISPKLRVVLHSDFMNYSGFETVFNEHDACIWCLGISQNAVNEQEYIRITYDYTIAAANAVLTANPNMTFVFLSGAGANLDEKSRHLFGRIKGRTEAALLKLPFKKLYIARPAAILPINSDVKFTFALKMQYLLARIFKVLTPSYVITSTKLAKALLYIAAQGAKETILSYRDINTIAKKLE